jgi:hypothetical protein
MKRGHQNLSLPTGDGPPFVNCSEDFHTWSDSFDDWSPDKDGVHRCFRQSDDREICLE